MEHQKKKKFVGKGSRKRSRKNMLWKELRRKVTTASKMERIAENNYEEFIDEGSQAAVERTTKGK